MQPLLSILIPSIPERNIQAMQLFNRIEKIMQGYDVEILILTDNLKNSIGQKREKLKNTASGKYFAFVDDDDDISFCYYLIADVILSSEPDVICFNSLASVNGEKSVVVFGRGFTNEQFSPNKTIYRKPFHVCAWKTELVKDIEFPDSNYGEDWHWSERALERVKTEHYIDAVLHYYCFDKNVSRAEN